MSNEYLKKLTDFSDRLNNDPEYLKEVQEKLRDQIVISENEDVFGTQTPKFGVGDFAALALDPNYLEEKRYYLLEVWYAFHGQGD